MSESYSYSVRDRPSTLTNWLNFWKKTAVMNGSDVGPSYGEPDEDKDKGQQEDWESSELFVSRSNLVLENLALRQQLTVRFFGLWATALQQGTAFWIFRPENS